MPDATHHARQTRWTALLALCALSVAGPPANCHAQVQPTTAPAIAEAERAVWEQTPPSHAAVQSLGTMGQDAIPALIRMMREHPGGDIRFLSQEALARIGEPAVEPMEEVLRDGDAAARMAAVLGLEKVLGARAVPVLEPLLGDPNKGVVARAAGALVRITGDAARYLPLLVDALKTGNDGDKWIAAESLDWCKSAAAPAVADLVEALKTSRGGVRDRVLTALRSIGTEEAKAAVATEQAGDLKGDDVWERLRAAHAIGEAGPAASGCLQALRERVADTGEDVLVRGYCAWTISRIEPPEETVPSRLFHVRQQAPNASDGNPGTAEQPWKTIQRAAETMSAGDTVLIGSGVYREFVRPFLGGASYERMITYRAEPGADVVIKGSDVWTPAWESAQVGEVSVWCAPWQRLPWDRPEDWPEPRSAPMHRAEQVFVDGKLMTHVATKQELVSAAGSFCTDDAEGRLYLRLPQDDAPAAHLIERSTRQQVFAPAVRGLGYIRVQGLKMTHAANPESQGANWGIIGHRSALSTRRGHHWIIEDNEITWANAQGMDVGGEGWSADLQKQPPVSEECGFHQIRRNVVSYNGVAGIVGWSGVTGLLLEDNTTDHNCLKGNFYAYEAAGVKLHGTDHVIIRRHRSHANDAFGIWVDHMCHHTRITQCTVTENRGAGIFVEVSKQGPNLVDSNVVIGTRDASQGGWADGLYSHDADDVTWANNLVMNCRGWGVRLTRCIGRTAAWGETSISHHRVYNNILSGNARGAINLRPEASLSEDNLSDFNVLWGTGGPPAGTVDNSGINVDWTKTEVGKRLGLMGTASLTLPLPRWQEYGQDRSSIALPAASLLGPGDAGAASDETAAALAPRLAALWNQGFGLDAGVADYAPRPAQELVAALSAELRGATLVRQLMLSPSVGLQVWQKGQEPVVVAWDWAGPAQVMLPGQDEPTSLSAEPVFLHGVSAALLGPASLTVPAEPLSAAGGEVNTVTVGPGTRAYAVQAMHATVEGGELRIAPAVGMPPGDYSVLLVEDERWGVVNVSVVEALLIEGLAAEWAGGPRAVVRVANRLARPVHCRVELDDGASKHEATLSLPANNTGAAAFPLMDQGGFVPARVRASLPGGASASAEALLATARSVRAAGPPEVAGFWDRAPRYPLDGFPGGFFPESLRQAFTEKPGDLSARFASQWDDHRLYLRVEAKDDRHCQTQVAGEAWNQDSVQVLLEPRPLTGAARRLEFDVDLPSIDAARPRVFGRQAPGVEALPAEEIAVVAAQVQREGESTVYTVALPWTALGLEQAPGAGRELGLAIVVNDDDGDGRGRHGLQWFFGIHGFRGQYQRLGALWLG